MGLHSRFPILAAVLLLAACSRAPTEPLRIASSPWPGYEPIYLARDLGYLDPKRVLCIELPTGSVSFESFRNGSTDGTTMTLNQFMEVLRSGTKARIVAVLDYSNGADAVMANPTIRVPADLRGRRIALGNFAVAGSMLLRRTLAEAGLSLKDVTVFTDPDDMHEQTYRQGKADAIVTFEPFNSRLAALGAHPVFDSSRMPYEILDVLVVREDAFQKRHDDVCHLARQWFRALAYLNEQPDDAIARMGKRLGKTPAEFRTMLGGLVLTGLPENLLLLAEPSPEILKSAGAVNDGMAQFEGHTTPIDIRGSLDPEAAACMS